MNFSNKTDEEIDLLKSQVKDKLNEIVLILKDTHLGDDHNHWERSEKERYLYGIQAYIIHVLTDEVNTFVDYYDSGSC